jgi:hypothetical protein
MTMLFTLTEPASMPTYNGFSGEFRSSRDGVMDVLLWLQKSRGLQTPKAIGVPKRKAIPAVLPGKAKPWN